MHKQDNSRLISKPFLIEGELPWEPLNEGVSRQIMGYDVQVMMVKVSFEAGAVAPCMLTRIPRPAMSHQAGLKWRLMVPEEYSRRETAIL